VASYLAGGWLVGTIVTATSGSPFTVTLGGGGDPPANGFNGDFSMDYADPIAGGNATPAVRSSTQGQLLAFDPHCFAPASTVSDGVLVGNSGRNRFIGPGLTTADFSTFKNFSFREVLKLQFRAGFFNVLNHPNFATPNFLNDANNSIGSANAGVIGTTSTASRPIQLGLKLVW
jgi:hypothetical protein